jgi:hypothetical protein
VHVPSEPGSTPGDTPASTYAEEAAIQDQLLDGKLAGIRAREAAGDITVREAADMRVQALEHHIQCVRALREEHFGGDTS